jgi:hypothetical protein
VLEQFRNPLAILDVSLPPGHGFDVLRIHQHHLELTFENVPHRLPVHTGRLHRHMGYVMTL